MEFSVGPEYAADLGGGVRQFPRAAGTAIPFSSIVSSLAYRNVHVVDVSPCKNCPVCHILTDVVGNLPAGIIALWSICEKYSHNNAGG